MTQTEKIKLTRAVKEIIWMARRYTERRSTYAPEMFNDAYDIIRDILGDGCDKVHDPSDIIKNWPYATDGGAMTGNEYQKLNKRKYHKK